MTAVDKVRLDRLQALMKDQGIDVLVCRLPENVVYLTEYWPHHGVSVALLFQTGAPQLHAPEVEAEWAVPGWADVHPFGWSLLKDPDVYATYRDILGECAADLHPGNAVVAVEQTAEGVWPSYRSAEPIVPAAPWHAMLAEVFANATLVDATPILSEARGIKSPYEIEKLRTTAEVAEAAIKYAISKVEPGMTEAHIGALVEFHARSEGPGRNGARLVRCSAEVAAGLNTEKAVLLIPSTTYATSEGDLVMIEVGTVVDGYWSDLTYMAVVGGQPTDRQREVHNALLTAQHAAIAVVAPGNPQALPDQIARRELDRAGLGEYYPHITGHGIGLRYHEWVPMLMPGATGVLATGMYMAVEPGVYIPGFGGIRIEDNVLVGETGPVPLSTPRQPW
jgi:Xaa-Pro dipeptidase